MSTPISTTESTPDDLINRHLLRQILYAVLLTIGLTLVGHILTGDRSLTRPAVLLTLAIVVIISYVRLRRSLRQGAEILIVGMWLAVSAATVAYAGVHSSNLLVYGVLIVLTGWLLGERWLIGISALSIVLLLGLVAAELSGIYQPAPRANVLMVATIVVGSLVTLAFLTTLAYRSLNHERDRALDLSNHLAEHNLTLAQRERDLHLMMEHVPAGIASFDAQSRLRSGNTRYAALFGAKPDEIIGRHIADYAPKAALDQLMTHWEFCLAGNPSSYRRTNTDPLTGKVSTIDVELVPEFDQGRVVGLFALLNDVTEQVAAEAKIQELNTTLERRIAKRTAELEAATEKLQQSQEELTRSEAKATLSTLIASVSHELNTPIGNSVMAASTLGDQAVDFQRSVDAGVLKRSDMNLFLSSLREGTGLMQRNLHRAEDLLKNFRQVATDQASEQRRTFDLATVVQEIVDTLRPSLKRQTHQIVLDIPSGIKLDSYPGPLGQVIINLINNAYLHAFEGIDNGVFNISATSGENDVMLRFADNGCGISHETLTRLFEPFFSTKMGQGGTGLGMTIVENLVRKSLGGSIKVHSEVGVGTRFDIRLPHSAP